MDALTVFDGKPTDYEAVIHSLPSVISVIETAKSLALSCRQVIAGYSKELPYMLGMSEDYSNRKGRKYITGIQKKVTVTLLPNDIVKLNMIPLIKNLTAKTKEYLAQLIGDELKTYFTPDQKPNFSRQPCVLVINSLYDTLDSIRDNDNIEVSAIVNSLKQFLLADDDISLSIYRMGVLSDRYEMSKICFT